MKNTKRALMSSAIALLLCFSMLLGTTYAWFTDSASSAGNVIQSGNLDVEMYWSETLLAAESSEWKNAEGVPIFTHDKWEPGYTDVKYVKVRNAGNLALQWRLNIEAEGEVGELAEVIDVYYVNPATAEITTLDGLTSAGILKDVIANHTYTNGVLLPEGETSTEYGVYEAILAIAFHMHEEAGNTYQKSSVGDGFTVNLIATQFGYESDAFGKDYDKDAQWPNNVIVGGDSASADVDVTADNKVANPVILTSENGVIGAEIPAGVKLAAGVDKLTLTVNGVTKSEANVTLDESEAMLSMDVHIEGVAEDNDVVMAISRKALLPIGLNMGNYRFYHVENGNTVEMTLLADGATPVHNNYEYDPATGDVVLYLKSFSEVTVVAEPSVWKGGYDYKWYTDDVWDDTTVYHIANADQLAALSAIVGGMNGQEQDSFAGKTIKLLTDIDLNDSEAKNNSWIFYPIGYYNSTGKYVKNVNETNVVSEVYSFEGTFDGNGNTISNFYQNTWDMFGDYNDGYPANSNHYKDGMGLFGYVKNGTVKNLTIDHFSSDGEFTPTGVIAAFACNSTFENIAITNCNPRVYNTGNGGIVGIGGNSSDPDDYKLTFNNITIDNTNKITALWGSWDVACGGLVGMFRGAGHVNMYDCRVAAQIDVYNDVCGNYQYYWYRYAGMLVGTNKNMVTDEFGYTVPDTSKYYAEDCTVHFDVWNDYYYCELVANSLASYTHDHQMSRLTQVKAVNGTSITYLDDTVGTVPESGRYNYVVVNGNHGTDKATCYHFVNGAVWNHADAGVEEVDGETVLKEDKQHIYLPFNQLFTGYGWGVKHIPIYNDGVTPNPFEGVTVLDVQFADSVEKFNTKINNGTEFGMDITVTVGEIFEALTSPQYGIEADQVQVSVSPVGTDSSVEATFVPNETDWTQGKLTFVGSGYAKITITDYNFCVPKTVVVMVGSETPDEGFDGADDNVDTEEVL